jgi:membrane-bound metal-dependent hydrolase YbcI (DUF457 family)
MMGRSHVIAGAIAGELVARAASVHSVEGHALLVGIGAVGGLLPDIDCGSSMITRMLGPVGWVLSHAMRGFSHMLYAVTKGPEDERGEGEHRHASHTVLFALVAGLLVMAACWPISSLSVAPWLLGAAMAAGCFSHCLTDSMTVAGCPWLFPILIRGETWYEIRLLGPLSFHTGSDVERLFWRPAFALVAVALIPGLWPVLLSAVHSHGHALPNGAS